MTILKNGSRGNDVKLLQNMLNIVSDGDFGPKTETSVRDWQSSHKLVVDGIVGDNTWRTLFLKNINYISKPISKHITACIRKPLYIVIHYTAGCSSTSGQAMANRNVFNNTSSSADFCVDDMNIVQVNPDSSKYYCWAVGDGNGQYGITNKNSIHIEMCSTLDKGTCHTVPNHTGWHISEDVLRNTVSLTRYLMYKYDIPVSRVVRHYDASKKCCPGIIGWNDGVLYEPLTGKQLIGSRNNSQEWFKFKNRL